MKKIGIYAGSFDPLTLGHIDIVKRSLKFVDKIIIAVGNNSNKKYLFSDTQRVSMIEEVLFNSFNKDLLERIEVRSFEGLLVKFAEQNNVILIIRGIRALSDFDFEFNLSGVNSKLSPTIETVFLMSSEKHQFVSSKFVKEIAEFGGDLSKFVPTSIAEKLQIKFNTVNKKL